MWYYADGADRQGPLEGSDIDRLIADGVIEADTLVWREGMEGWDVARAHFQMTPSTAAPPPPPIPNTPIQPAAPTAEIGSDGLYIHAPSRSFGEAISTCFSKFVTFKGRASRSEYWFFLLFTLLVSIVTGIFDAILFPAQIDTVSPLNSIGALIVFLPALSANVRRVHDTDRSGWWIGGAYLIFGVLVGVVIVAFSGGAGSVDELDSFLGLIGIVTLVFFIYVIVILVFTLQKGTLGPNRFG